MSQKSLGGGREATIIEDIKLGVGILEGELDRIALWFLRKLGVSEYERN